MKKAIFEVRVGDTVVHSGNNFMVASCLFSRLVNANKLQSITLFHNGAVRASRVAGATFANYKVS
jgi:hypothetical protein